MNTKKNVYKDYFDIEEFEREIDEKYGAPKVYASNPAPRGAGILSRSVQSTQPVPGAINSAPLGGEILSRYGQNSRAYGQPLQASNIVLSESAVHPRDVLYPGMYGELKDGKMPQRTDADWNGPLHKYAISPFEDADLVTLNRKGKEDAIFKMGINPYPWRFMRDWHLNLMKLPAIAANEAMIAVKEAKHAVKVAERAANEYERAAKKAERAEYENERAAYEFERDMYECEREKYKSKGLNEKDRETAFGILRDCFYLWFAYPGKGENIPGPYAYFVPWKWSTAIPKAQAAIADIKAHLVNDPAKKKLLEKLQNMGILTDKPHWFDFTRSDPVEWDKHSYQSRPVSHWPEYCYGQYQLYALGNFNISALPRGYVRPLPDGSHEICITEVYLFVNDHFNFEGKAPLGFWDFDNLRFEGLNPRHSEVTNDHFRAFRKTTGYGRNFRVVSPLQKVKEFKPTCWQVRVK